MEEMKTIYQVEGKLCKDFIGQISYTVCLDQTYGELECYRLRGGSRCVPVPVCIIFERIRYYDG